MNKMLFVVGDGTKALAEGCHTPVLDTFGHRALPIPGKPLSAHIARKPAPSKL